MGTCPAGDGDVLLSCPPKTEARIFATRQPVEDSQLRSIRTPALVARGSSRQTQSYTSTKLASRISTAMGNAQLETFNELGHFGPMENGAAIAQSIRAHLEPLTLVHSSGG